MSSEDFEHYCSKICSGRILKIVCFFHSNLFLLW